MTPLRVAAASAAVAVLVVAAALLYRLPLEHAVVLAPVIVATVGATLFLLVLWTKVAYETLRRRRHPYRIVAGTLAAIGLLVVLSFFVELPTGY
jgi:ABC-type enterochelin transport system permease subunit